MTERNLAANITTQLQTLRRAHNGFIRIDLKTSKITVFQRRNLWL